MMKTTKAKYYVWNPSGTAPKVEHLDHNEALAEAKRLASLPVNHGQEFYVLRAICSIKYSPSPFIQTNYAKS